MLTLTLSNLVNAAVGVGLRLEPRSVGDRDANLYVWCTPEDEVLYVGKSSNHRRAIDEHGFVRRYDPQSVNVGFVMLQRRQRATCMAFRFVEVDPRPALTFLEQWEGRSFTRLQEDLNSATPWTEADAELVLIRIAVLAGFPIANSTGSGQWESSFGTRTNTLAALAVDQFLALPDGEVDVLQQLAGD
ncbi:hypothetical protein IU11_06195 [Cellulosimicrobium sp. MM]|nr:GIY-YIG nuclease family protein [Cellulosimicrobium sp. MM]KFD44020.1 hypothetical protein IU11_06195 [Cellulosimicrobium sp. MM]